MKTVRVIDPLFYCYSEAHGRPSMVEYSLAGDCGGHETGKRTAVEVGEEVLHYAKSEGAALRWAQRFACKVGTRVERGES